MKRGRLILTMIGVLAIFGMGHPVVSHAADATTPQPTPEQDLANALASMPQGLPINGYFITPTFNNSTVKNSSAVTLPNSDGTQAVQLTNNTNQLGTIWANKDQFYFDLKKKQKASMWMYFGDGPLGHMGDGMAFVIQNAGYQATAVDKNGVPQGQETLGVWGLPDNFTADEPSSVGKQAIQKSWALEFDTFPNGGSYFGVPDITGFSTFDLGKKVAGGLDDTIVNQHQHIAADYPADQKQGGTYYSRYSPDSTTMYGVKMNHRGIIVNNGPWLTDGAWHHLTVQYTPPADDTTTVGNVTYTINDKDPSTGTASQNAQSNNYELDTNKVDDGTGHAYWGFTGSTGQYGENNLVVFEQIPGLVDADASASVANETANLEGPINVNTPVMGGNRLRLDYNLTYNSGRSDWTPKAQINLPSGFVPSSAVVTFADGTTQTVDLGATQTGQQLNFTLAHALNETDSTADITIHGRQSNPTNPSTVINGTTSKFVDKQGIATADTTPYTVYQATTTFRIGWASGENYDSVTTAKDKDVTVNGKFMLSGSPITANGFILQGSVNGTPIKDQSIPASDVSGTTTSGFNGTFSYTVPAASLHSGVNTLMLYVTSYDGYTTDSLVSNIDVSGPLQFGDVDDSVSYTADLTGSHMLVPRDGAWTIDVNDQRGTGSSWALMARMNQPLQATNVPATTMNLVYKSSSDATPVVLGSDAQRVAARTTTSNDDTFNATDQWDSNTGLLLDVSGGATAGTYTGQIEWSLENAPS
ncbi:hypothetical protein [Levilactobacillus andaensis]|uniref:hypothetical protein n=1 Tax=Levilactobacillus andaensis TaxID=2799570 RepID=UPI0019429166|nr:hypothetical protein [Levilactobacillus andaensis]